MDAELRDALNQLAEDLRGEIRSGDAETRAYIDEVIGASAAATRAHVDEVAGASAAETRAYIAEVVGASAAETRRHSGVIGESLRGEIRALA